MGTGVCVDAQGNHGSVTETFVDSSNIQNCRDICDADLSCAAFDDRASGCLVYQNPGITRGNTPSADFECYRKYTGNYPPKFAFHEANALCTNYHQPALVTGSWSSNTLDQCGDLVASQGDVCVGDFFYFSPGGQCGCASDACITRTSHPSWDVYSKAIESGK